MRTREVEGIGVVGLIISSNGGVGHSFLRAEDLGTLKVGTTSTEFVHAFKVGENLRTTGHRYIEHDVVCIEA
jgi:hypothetical protein